MIGFVFFIAAYLAGEWISTATHLPIPGSVIGLVLVLGLLVVRANVDAPIKAAADTFLRYLALMLVPIGVAVVKLVTQAPSGVGRLEVVLIAALIVGASGTALLMRGLIMLQNLRTGGSRPAPAPAGTTR